MHMSPHPRTMDSPNYAGLFGLSAMDPITQRITQESIGTATAGGALALALLSPATGAAFAVPVAGAILAAGVGLYALFSTVFSGCGQSCVVTSDAANKIEQALQQNLRAYQSSPRTQADQAQALANFDYAWGQLEAFCGNPQFSTAGRNCIADRQAGACHFKDASGACWNWVSGYRDPIADDPSVRPNLSPESPTSQSGDNSLPGLLTAGSPGSFGGVLLLAAIALLFLGGSGK